MHLYIYKNTYSSHINKARETAARGTTITNPHGRCKIVINEEKLLHVVQPKYQCQFDFPGHIWRRLLCIPDELGIFVVNLFTTKVVTQKFGNVKFYISENLNEPIDHKRPEAVPKNRGRKILRWLLYVAFFLPRRIYPFPHTVVSIFVLKRYNALMSHRRWPLWKECPDDYEEWITLYVVHKNRTRIIVVAQWLNESWWCGIWTRTVKFLPVIRTTVSNITLYRSSRHCYHKLRPKSVAKDFERRFPQTQFAHNFNCFKCWEILQFCNVELNIWINNDDITDRSIMDTLHQEEKEEVIMHLKF